MKQFQFEYKEQEMFLQELSNFREQCDSGNMNVSMFQIFTEVLDWDVIHKVCEGIEEVFPEVPYMGCSTSGNIVDCQLSYNITVVCTMFELPSTQVKIFQYDLTQSSVEQITETIVAETKQYPWVKAIEMFFTIPETSTTRFCDGLRWIRRDIQIFGGVACSDDITSDASCVFSKANGVSEKSILIVFYGCENFYVDSINVT